jgi:polyisoprenoid-binding protein YceI
VTAVLPAKKPLDSLPPQGTYELRPGRCVIEVAVRILGRPLLRGRFRAVRGTLVVGEPGTVRADLSAKSLRANVPLLSGVLTGPRGLSAARHRTVDFTGTVSLAGPLQLDIAGVVRVRYVSRPLSLRARVVHVDDGTVVLAAHGVLRRQRFPRRLWVEAAAELTR